MPRETMTIRKDAITTLVVPVFTVAHLTDYSTRAPFTRPCVLNQSKWFNEEAARQHALEESQKYPAPQRFTIYDPDLNFVVTYQCGKEVGAFVLVE